MICYLLCTDSGSDALSINMHALTSRALLSLQSCWTEHEFMHVCTSETETLLHVTDPGVVNVPFGLIRESITSWSLFQSCPSSDCFLHLERQFLHHATLTTLLRCRRELACNHD